MSKIMSSSNTVFEAFNSAAAAGENSLAQTTSVGTGMLPPRDSASAVNFLQVSIRSASYKDLPTG